MPLNMLQMLGRSSTVSDINFAEIATVVFLAVTVVLTISFWYMANRPNIIVRPELQHGALDIVLRNDGKVSARKVVLKSGSILVDRSSDPPRTLDAQLPSMAPGEEIRYFVTVGAKAESIGTVTISIEHYRWFFRWVPGLRRCGRDVSIDFSQYAGALAGVHVPSNLENLLEKLAEIGYAHVMGRVNEGDRRRMLKHRLQLKATQVRKRAVRWLASLKNRRCS